MRSARGLVAALAVGMLGASLWGCAPTPVPEKPFVPAGPAYRGPAPEQVAADGMTVMVGDPQAPVTVRVYLDPRSLLGREFEVDGGGAALRTLVREREAKVEYALTSSLDDSLGGSGSHKAVNALRAAAEQKRFVRYLGVLYENQPEESEDGFTDEYLLEMAYFADSLRGPEFDDAVKTVKYADFVARSDEAFEKAGGADGQATPVVYINGSRMPDNLRGTLFNRGKFEQLVQEVRRNPQRWG